MNNHEIGLIIVGDEILSGRRQDKHFPKVIELLTARGMQLQSLRVLPDDRTTLTQALKESFASGQTVLCCGGIGATPDDHTRQAAAAALNLPLMLHPEAEKLIAKRCADMAAKGSGSAEMTIPENLQRLQMGFFPQGAEVVHNPFNGIPGFYIERHTFLPGFPVMAWPMIEMTLDQRYAHMHHLIQHAEESFLVFGLPESRITPALEALEIQWPGVKAFSLPSVGDAGEPPHIELGAKGDPAKVHDAVAYLRQQAQDLGARFS